MKYVLIENNIVVQIQPNKQDGFVEVDDSVICGMLFDSGVFTTPDTTPKSIQQQIDELESSITKRNLRGLRIGDTWAISKVAEIDAAVELLRAKL